MSRKLEQTIVNHFIEELLERLIDKSTDSHQYANTMYQLGVEFGKVIFNQIRQASTITLACTVEDADYLGKGILDVLEQRNNKVSLTVFWNKRFKAGDKNGISVAPIIREYHEKGFNETHILIILKSIIANSCVVRTNLTRLIEESRPEVVLVVAPVLLKGAKENLEREFDQSISRKFRYLYFAEDDEKTTEGIVLPGIGGDVYQRLGFTGQEAKNRFTPSIVKERRYRKYQI
jgi:hypothetical protein